MKYAKTTTSFLLLICLLPILLAQGQMFDSVTHSTFFITQEKFFIEIILAHGWYIMYWLHIAINELYLLTDIEPKLFFNLISVIAIIGAAREVFIYLESRFHLGKEAALIGAWSFIAFPIWHVAFAAFFTAHLICLWAFMAAVNIYRKKLLLAVGLLALSLNLFSLYPFAVGIACVEYYMTVTRKNWLGNGIKVLFFGVLLSLAYFATTSIVSVHGETGTYNTINFRWSSLYNYAILAIACLSVWALSKRLVDEDESKKHFKYVVSFLILCFFAAFAYWAVDRPLKYFNFGSFSSRHTLLTSIPYALFAAVIAAFVQKRWGRKALKGFATFLLTISIVVLYQGYDHKVAALLFKNMLTSSLQQTPPPPSGYVSIEAVGYEAPRHVHDYAINMCFYKAYGRASWMANGFWARRGFVYDEESMRELYDIPQRSKRQLLAFEVTGDAFTKYTFTLKNYHQEGRTWYWYNYLARDYNYFSPRLTNDSS